MFYRYVRFICCMMSANSGISGFNFSQMTYILDKVTRQLPITKLEVSVSLGFIVHFLMKLATSRFGVPTFMIPFS